MKFTEMSHHPVPPILYKYTSSDTALIILKNGKLRWSDPRIFNDIAEFQRMPQFEPTLAEAVQMLPGRIVNAAIGTDPLDEERLAQGTRAILELARLLLKNGCSASEAMDRLRTNWQEIDGYYEELQRTEVERILNRNPRVLCLTANHESRFMWGNYADKNRGIVLGFKHIPEKSTPFLEARKVEYSDSTIIASGLDYLLYSGGKELGRKTSNAIFYTKTAEWASEEEWRIMTTRPQEAGEYGDYPFYPEELESVIIGARASVDTIEQICKTARQNYPHAKIFAMKSHHGKLSKVPID